MSEQIWVVRAGRNAAYIREFVDQKMVAIGWGEVGDLAAIQSRDAIIELVAQRYPMYNRGQVIVNGSQIFRFRSDLPIGSKVLTYEQSTRTYHLGSILGEYKYRPDLNEHLRHTHSVVWERTVRRDDLSAPTKSSLGSIATIFRISESATNEILQGISPLQDEVKAGTKLETAELEAEAEVRQDTEQRALEFLQDKLNQLDWAQMQELVAGLLRAMGYKTRVSPAGPDRGRDIIASPDGFGFQQPRILVEVKHRTGQIGAPLVRSFTGGLRQGDNGLYVSTGGFSREARYEADRSNHPITLMDSEDLGNAIVEHYDEMDLEARSILPMRKIYWPI